MTRLRALKTRLAAERWALLPLRLLLGFGFAAHGWAKLARGPGSFATILDAIGVPAATLMAWLTSLVELLGGLALMAGLSVAALSVPLGAIMATALVTVHLRYGFSSIRLKAVTAAGAEFGPVGFELNLLYVAGLLALALGGTSPLSVDRWLEGRREERKG